MAVMVDTSCALRTPEELVSLVQAIVAALPEDELDWIEWKIAGDLGSKATAGTIARHILGMANRIPDRAALHAQGCGYLVMGAQPGSLSGIVPVDPANLGLAVQPYLGSEGPTWTHQYVPDGQVTVLVVMVEPPMPGHRIFTLQKEFTRISAEGGGSKTYRAGTIFVRHPGRTEIAQPGEIKALEDRYAAPALEAGASARRTLELEEARAAAEERDRRMKWLAELSRLVIATQFKARPYAASPGYFRCEEQMELQTLLAGMDYGEVQVEMPAVWALAGAGQGMEAFGAATRANTEIQAAMRKLAVRRGG
jgi:hypothetical protein